MKWSLFNCFKHSTTYFKIQGLLSCVQRMYTWVYIILRINSKYISEKSIEVFHGNAVCFL
jgi:hypothetical protein